MKSIGALDWLVLAVYMGVVAFLGIWFARKQKSTENYFVGGRNIPGWAIGLSLFGSAISTVTFLTYPGNGFAGNWAELVPGLMLPFGVIFVTLLILPFYRRVIRMSVYEYLEKRFGYPARFYAAITYIMLNVFRTGFVLFLAAVALNAMTGWDVKTIIIVAGLVTIIYTMVGGLEAVIWTDVMQSFVLLGGGLICAAFLLFTPEGGPVNVINVAYEAGKFQLADWSWDLTGKTMMVMALYGIVMYAANYTTLQENAQRFLAASSTSSARKGIWLGAIVCISTWTLFMFIGSLLYSYYQISAAELPPEIIAKETKVFPYFVMTQLPAGIVGLILAAMCAAAMSSLDTTINCLALVSVYDLYVKARPNTSEKHLLMVSRLATCFWGLVGTAAALSMINVQRALDFSYKVGSILIGGMFGMFALALFVRRAHALGVYIGLACGVLVTAWGTLNSLEEMGLHFPQFLEPYRFPFHTFMIAVFTNLTTFVVGWIACLILPDITKKDPTGLTVWDLKNIPSEDANA